MRLPESPKFWWVCSMVWAVLWIIGALVMIWYGQSLEWYMGVITVHAYLGLASLAFYRGHHLD